MRSYQGARAPEHFGEYVGLYVNTEMRAEGVLSGKGFAFPSYEFMASVFIYTFPKQPGGTQTTDSRARP